MTRGQRLQLLLSLLYFSILRYCYSTKNGTQVSSFFSLCRNGKPEANLTLRRAITITSKIFEDDKIHFASEENTLDDVLKFGLVTSSPKEKCSRTFRIHFRAGTMFLVVFRNDLPLQLHNRCSLWDSILEVKSGNRSINFGCSKFVIEYFQSPLTLNVITPAIREFTLAYPHHTLTITITPIVFGCVNQRYTFLNNFNIINWMPCNRGGNDHNDNVVCIHRDFVCDNENNCGQWEDEIRCPNFNETLLPYQSSAQAPCHTDDYFYYHNGDHDYRLPNHFDGVLSFVLAFCAFLLLSIVITITVYCLYVRKKLKLEDNRFHVANYMRRFRMSRHGRRKLTTGSGSGGGSSKFGKKAPPLHRSSDDMFYRESFSAPAHHKMSSPLLPGNGSVRTYCSNSISDPLPINMPAKCKRFF